MKTSCAAVITCLAQAVFAIQNPIVTGFNPDPAILRLGNEYFIATSSFEFFPGFPIYKSSDLQNWELYSHALTRPSQLQLYGTPGSAGVWAPSLTYINGRIYLVGATRWTYDPVAKVWPRAIWLSSTDMKDWSEVTWGDAWGIDPEIFHDEKTNSSYLNIMAPNNNKDRRSVWNGTLPHNATARPEGPKMFFRDPYYYMLIAEGGTDELHRASIARSSSPEGPWLPGPNNPLIYNGAFGFKNLTVQSTGHADMVETPTGEWYASFIARRDINGSSPLGRETFLTTVTWKDDWPVFNNGNPILLSDGANDKTVRKPLEPFVDDFNASCLHPEWYRIRTPYTETFELQKKSGNGSVRKGLTFLPNVFSLSDRDHPAALFRKQKALNMTFTAYLQPIKEGLQYRQSVGISAYLSELAHHDLGVRKCAQAQGLCVYSSFLQNGTLTDTETPLNSSSLPSLALEIRATPTTYTFSFFVPTSSSSPQRHPVASLPASWLDFAPPGWFIFTGTSFALFASGNGEPWPFDAPDVGFVRVEERYGEDWREDYQ